MEEFFSYPHVAPTLAPWAEEWLRNNRTPETTSRFLRLECNHYALLKSVVEHSDAISGAPRIVIQTELDQQRLSIVRLPIPSMFSRAGVVWLTDRPPTAAGKLLIDELCRS
jgi:DNA-binding transcriptional LysR family regulator